MKESRVYKITIFNDDYSIVSDEPEERIVRSAQLIDSFMKEAFAVSSLADQKKIAVLAGLRLASKVVELENEKASVTEKLATLSAVITSTTS